MNNTVEFTIDGVGTFEFRSQLTHIEESKLNLLIDKFMDYEIDEIRTRAIAFQDKAIERILKKYPEYSGREMSDLSDEERKNLDDLYFKDDSHEALIAKGQFWQINHITNVFKLDMLKVRLPDGINFQKMDEPLFFRIYAEYQKAIEPITQKKN